MKSMCAYIARFGVALIVLSLSAPPALAWGDQGHAVVALVAEHFLTPAAKTKIDALLKSDTDALTEHSMAMEASWADKFRDSDKATTKQRYDRTRGWHTLDLQPDNPDLAHACKESKKPAASIPASQGPESCILDKIERFTAELLSPATKPPEKLLALKYLIHLVGDLHQPVLTIDNGDGHGIATRLSAGSFSQMTMRGFWDEGFIEELGDDAALIADDLISGVTQSKSQAAIGKGAPGDWALEAAKLARTAYAKLPDHTRDAVYDLEAPYITFGIETVRLQMARAGVRLAAILNQAFP